MYAELAGSKFLVIEIIMIMIIIIIDTTSQIVKIFEGGIGQL